jgi:ABC-type multidrug transport system fused ATPase/permease subunit
MAEGQITLDTAIASAGSNLSVGQRQILALARAIVRGSKLMILDEGMSSILFFQVFNMMHVQLHPP